jgi:hypothetical protein
MSQFPVRDAIVAISKVYIRLLVIQQLAHYIKIVDFARHCQGFVTVTILAVHIHFVVLQELANRVHVFPCTCHDEGCVTI